MPVATLPAERPSRAAQHRSRARSPLMTAGLMAGLMAGLAACSASQEAATTASPAVAGAAGSGASAVDVTSVEFFKVSVGDTVFFPTDQSELTSEAQAVLARQAAWLQQNPSVAVRIEGHADERGTREYNLALGARRANAVYNYLRAQGVNPGRMEPVTFGRERPMSTCPDETCWAQNRRTTTAPQG